MDQTQRQFEKSKGAKEPFLRFEVKIIGRSGSFSKLENAIRGKNAHFYRLLISAAITQVVEGRYRPSDDPIFFLVRWSQLIVNVFSAYILVVVFQDWQLDSFNSYSFICSSNHFVCVYARYCFKYQALLQIQSFLSVPYWPTYTFHMNESFLKGEFFFPPKGKCLLIECMT